MAYDLEALVFDIDAMLRTKLNAEIILINTEKADAYSIDQITANAFAVQSLDDNIDNYPNFVFTMLDNIQALGIGPKSEKAFDVLVLVIASGTENELQSSRRMFRYGRALEQCFEKNWATTSTLPIKLKVGQIPPQDYIGLNSTKKFKTVGISISGSFV